MKRTYSEMKDSGVEWLGEIPKEWNLKKAKFLFEQRNTRGNNRNLELLSPTQRYGVIPQSKYEELTNMRAVKLNEQVDLINFKTIHAGDYCISLRSFQGGFEYSQYEGVVSPAYQVFYARELISNNYYKYLFKDSCFINRINSFTLSLRDGKNISYMDFAQIELPYPPLSEQNVIANYLDAKCAEIDSIISEAKNCVEEYKQWKSSVIFEAVTKGLNPNAEMKDSKVEWIGEIPKGWRITKILNCLSMPITDGPHTTPEFLDEGIPFISAEAVSCGNGTIDFGHIRGFISEDFYTECCEKYTPQINDILMIKSGATTGKVAIVNTGVKFTIWSPLAVFRSNIKLIFPKFLFYYLQSSIFQKQIKQHWTYGTQQNIGMRVLETLEIIFPPLSEQTAIANYLDAKCAQIDEVISEKESLISDLDLYKKSLIYEVVTGKIKVS